VHAAASITMALANAASRATDRVGVDPMLVLLSVATRSSTVVGAGS
jgi:hypothetical protein